jgi:hypothetical protein
MAKEKFELEEDECLNCGAVRYVPSKVPGLCLDCNPVDKPKNAKTPDV